MGLGPGLAVAQVRFAATHAQAQFGQANITARMAFDRRQAQAQHLPGKGFAGQHRLHLAQAAALAQHQLADTPLLALRKPRCIHMRHQICAVAVVVVVRNHLPDLVQRASPGQLAACLRWAIGIAIGQRLVEQRQRYAGHTRGMRFVYAKPLLELAHRLITHIARPLALLGGDALVQIDDDTLAQRTFGGQQFGDIEIGHQRVEDGQPARQYRTAFGFQAGQVDAINMAGLDGARHAPAQALGRDAAVADACGLQHLRDGACGAG